MSVIKKLNTTSAHIALLVVFCMGCMAILFLPVLLAGFPPYLPWTEPAKFYIEHWQFNETSSRLMILFTAVWSSVISWRDLMGWTLLNIATMMGAVFFLWLTIIHFFEKSIAWVAVAIFAFMPIYWLQSVHLNGYALALLLLFAASSTFLSLKEKNMYGAILLSGFLFGCSIAARDALITFIPWISIVLLWQLRSRFKVAAISLFLLGCSVITGFVSPFIPAFIISEMPFNERVAEIISSASRRTPKVDHLYPDNYTYEVDRAEYDEILRQSAEEGSFLERRQGEHYRMIFGVESSGFFHRFSNSLWLMINQIPPLFLQDTIGGIFLWLFIIPGFLYCWKKHRSICIFMVGLAISMEFVIRFALQFGRIHLMNTAWILAIFAAVGVVVISRRIAQNNSSASVISLIAIIISLQLIQANRKQFARIYTSSIVPSSFAAEVILEDVDADAVVAHPRQPKWFYFSELEHVGIHSETIDRYMAKNNVQKPLEYYGVTHIMGYSPEQSEIIKQAMPEIVVLPAPQNNTNFTVQLTPFVRYLLHIIR